jgi:hypothetical protein
MITIEKSPFTFKKPMVETIGFFDGMEPGISTSIVVRIAGATLRGRRDAGLKCFLQATQPSRG